MAEEYEYLGWEMSPFSQKMLTYLKFKDIPHINRAPNAYELMRKVPARVGKAVMPTVRSPEGEWWQDSAEIMDRLEQRFPENPVVPETPKQKIVSYLFEMHADEWLVLAALHYRWSRPASAKFIVDEFGRLGLPWFPGFIRRMMGRKIQKSMMSYLPKFGITGIGAKGVEQFTEQLLPQLDKHLSAHKYLLGDRPCMGDFAMFGQVYAHLYRDPGSRCLFDDKPAIVEWINRMLNPETVPKGDFLTDDQIPDTLIPMLETIFREQFEFIRNVISTIDGIMEEDPSLTRVSRIIGKCDFVIGGEKSERLMFAFTQWKVQRALDPYHALEGKTKEDVKEWLCSLGGDAFTNTVIRHRMIRRNNKEIMESASA